ncbi:MULTISPECIES: PepSY domain-containing protein [unclassified Frigoribacterium]|uniref:PepSY domain-containing protein n=1 Tax=unclassified Frigoribacterium TaxID=2627005 RepID=UPI00156315BE|nr:MULTISPECIES: PepSY domain-containing protein [unclassified Frigoribacterium]NQW87088.1 PepSY domain-containing protein [Frigoribacterium sp. VKM Ac-2860]NQX08419.1 PepSY domain-containing protein [Frigoribacterium sp. VKM Ac-2859]
MLKNTLTKKKSLLIAGGIAGVLVLGGGGVALASDLDDGVSAQTRDRAQEAALAETGGGTVTEVDTLDDGLVGYEVEVVLPDGREATVLLDGDHSVTSSRVDDDSRGSGATPTPVAGDDRDDDSLGSDATPTPAAGPGLDDSARDDSARDDSARDDDLTGADYDRAAAAALAAAGGGTVTDADRSDDTGVAYEVDVRLDDGTEVDVDLDQAFGVVRTDVDARR